MRHTCTTEYNGRPVIVAMGFDVPLQGYFMTVEPADEDEDNPDANEETGMIYSNLDDDDLRETCGFSKSIELYKKRLREMNIEVPEIFFVTVLAD